MKLHCLSRFVSLAAGGAVLPFTLLATQGPSPVPAADMALAPYQSPTFARVGWDESKRKKLRHAYWILEQANHDYGRHRATAMAELAKAAKILDLDLKGDGYGGVRQPWSDALLRDARRDLQDIVEPVGGEEYKHIRNAIKEIDHALEPR